MYASHDIIVQGANSQKHLQHMILQEYSFTYFELPLWIRPEIIRKSATR